MVALTERTSAVSFLAHYILTGDDALTVQIVVDGIVFRDIHLDLLGGIAGIGELLPVLLGNAVAVGGSSRLRGLKERIFDEISIPVEISEDPMTVVAKGTAIVAAEPLALEPEVRLRAMK